MKTIVAVAKHYPLIIGLILMFAFTRPLDLALAAIIVVFLAGRILYTNRRRPAQQCRNLFDAHSMRRGNETCTNGVVAI